MSWILANETITASPNEKYLLDTTDGQFSVTLPEFPLTGTSVILAAASEVSVNKVLVIAQEQFPFEGGSEFFVIDVNKSQQEFVFDGFNWIVYNLSRPGTKVSNLPEQPTSQISNDDLIPYVNRSGNSYESTAIPFINLKQRVTEDVFTSADDIIDAINESGLNGTLNVGLFDGRTPDFYRNYDNLNNKPIIPTNVSQLNNNLGFVSNLSTFTTTNLAEGPVNKYLTEPNFRALFDPAFAEAYRLFSGDLPEQSVRDSFDNIAATPLTTSSPTSFINILNPDEIELFFTGKKIRIYGATINPVINIPTPAMGSATKRGFTGITGSSNVRYKVIQFNYLSGEFSPTSNESNAVEGIDFDAFNDVNNISVRFSRTNTEYGILIYRSTGGSFFLIDVLGQKQLGSAVQNIEYVDYGKFNYVPWSRKSLNNGNAYNPNTGIVHFPTIVSNINSSSRGWADATVISVDTAARRIRIDSDLYFSSEIVISEDDTEQLQNAINQRQNLGVNSLTLNDRRYIVSRLNVPSNFALYGRSQATVLRKLAWDFGPNNKIVAPAGTTAQNIVLSNFSIDGNMQNQWLKAETGDIFANYAVDLKENGIGNTLDRIRMINIVGGGVSSPRATKLLVDKSRIEDSGMSDLYDYSPLIADDGAEVVITNNILKNFTAAIDLSLSDNGVFTSNIVENVGSGVIIYGSKFLISAPNIIRGPAGEFVPGPDVINSVYDSVNINLEPGTSYVSDVYKYQENGINFDITANRAELNFRMDKLRLVNNAEELYGEILMSNVVGQEWDLAQIAEAIGLAAANTEPEATLFVDELLTANTFSLGDINQDGFVDGDDEIALLAYANGTQTDPAIIAYIEDDFIPFLDQNLIAYADYRMDVVEFVKPIQRVFDVDLDPAQGDFKFSISSTHVDTIMTDFSVTNLKETETNHIGLVYSANLTEYVPSGNIIGTPVANGTSYQVTITNFKNLSIGSKVRMLNHGGTPNLNNLVGTVTGINTVNANPTPPAVPEIVVTINYDEAVTVVGTGGQITVENTFILAKGRVL